MLICQRYLLPYIGHNNIEITFYLNTKVISSLLKKAPNYLYYIPKAYISYYNAYYFCFAPFANI